MKRMLSGVAVVACVVAAHAQTHKVAKPQDVVRAVGVYEWTGDLAKPTASRLIPITVYIDGKLEDGGEYLARPVPFALLSGNLYELDQAGLTKGNLELAYARHMRALDTATGESLFDDGWFGYGSFKAPAAPRRITPLKPSPQVSQITSSKDDGKPHFAGKQPAADTSGSGTGGANSTGSGSGSSSGSGNSGTTASNTGSSSGSTPAGDPDRPTMRRRDGSSSSSSGSGSSTSSGSSTTTADSSTPSSDDPDRPHLTRKPSTDDSVPPDPNDKSSGSGSSTTTTASSGGSKAPAPEGGSADDPDRPTLKRRSPQDAKNGQKNGSSVTGSGLLADDPDRPNLHRGKPTSAMNEDDLPKLKGLPADLHQMVAVSDAVNRDPHDFSRPWEDDAERTAILTKMQTLARAKLAAYGAAATTAGTAAAKGAPAPPTPKPGTAAAAAAARRAAAAKKTAAALPPVALADEELKGFMLSYGGAPTYVYSAHTEGTASGIVYVTIVAQTDSMGEFKPAIQSVTDAAHLDRTPRMRLVDAVDVEASNRASLLFELRGEKSRQFGIYRVIGAQANQTFVTGTTE